MRRSWCLGAAVLVGTLLAGCTSTTSGAGSSSSTGAVTVLSTQVVAPSSAVTVPDVSGSAPSSSEGGSSSAPSSNPSASLPSTPATSASPTPVLPAAKVSSSPALGAQDLSPAAAIKISVADGTITTLALTNPTGKVVKGALSADKKSWTLGEVLGFGKTYTATGTAVGSDGKNVAIKGTYTTVGEDMEAGANVTPGDGEIVGVAQPVIIRFPVEPTDKAAIEKALTITTTPKVQGSWGWIHHDDGWGIDWRPKDYWPANTKVHVDAKIYGLRLSAGNYVSSDLTSDFTIGRSQVVYADAKSYNIVVKTGCKGMNDPGACTGTSTTYLASYGSGDEMNDPNRVTRSGIHVVNEMLPVHSMSNPAYGYTHSVEYWDVRISNNGEFIHENPNTVGDQGNTNVSHGCINMSPSSAQAYFKSALIGDPVEVTGTSVQLSANDGDLFDWTLSWSQWQGLSAL